MRLDFNLLWIEDQPDAVRSVIDRLNIHVDREGFSLKVTQVKSLKAAEPHLAEEIFLDDIDLVLVDYDLGSGSGGEMAAREIRLKVPYKDIIFYSSNSTTNLKELMNQGGVEGVFCSHRDTLAETTMGVFDTLVKKVLDLDQTRGIVMGATSDIDYIVIECLEALSLAMSDKDQANAYSYAMEKVEARIANINETRQKVQAANTISAFLAEHEHFTANDRLALLKKILTLHFTGGQTEIRKAIGNYINEILPQRNKLGHVKVVVKDSKRKLTGKAGLEISVADLKKLRRTLIVYRTHFDNLMSILGINPT